jgi:predicted RNA-binding Zn ribbon-like protein
VAKDRWQFDFSGRHLAVDFANTVSKRHIPFPIERLPAYDDLVEFALQAGLLSVTDGRRLRAWAAGHPLEAEAIHQRSLQLRDALYEIFAAVARGGTPEGKSLDMLNAGIKSLRIGAALTWEWQAGRDTADAMLAPVLEAALELLLSDKRQRVRRCAAGECRWLFLDTSKNNSRRWCDMTQCGNRIKARRFYARQRGERVPG